MICFCDLISPPTRIVRAVEFRCDLAQYYCHPRQSGDAIVDNVLTEIYDHHRGRLVGPDGMEIPVDGEEGAKLFDSIFGEDAKRFINRLRENAVRRPQYLLQRRCVLPVVILHFARQIKLCRTEGPCSRR